MKRVIPMFVAVVATLISNVSVSQAQTPVSGKSSIRWYTDLDAGYAEAILKEKPMVVVFLSPLRAEETEAQFNYRKMWYSAEIETFADDAVFSVVEIEKVDAASDKLAEKLAAVLEVEEMPYMAILEPNPKTIDCRGRFEGAFETDEMSRLLSEYLISSPATELSQTRPAPRPPVRE